ncbi:aspartate-semialdehyde dehydrogenase [Campylobacter sp. RM9344]|uniref:Aspartate-semialdehyde dehydrogenase n=1 Tax=Campylobacter californiensis TaxID=1032243 RepID=A0AAW3ZU96_9BACT|nr:MULTISPECIES: aspartate-semialdehyde dehydrogenase [unclassified Campylobacter]MBE2985471.1 aspartate-semialdehyde dehydrogenase [Campylobacter sp. RM6883]MBE2987256.1 aspartate-semialdehyde dehydrogenase [Campylobacter sp. RM12919]MBE2988932.1 aspartate-semialdehyde dehydrogenase [Campylobacter sp. RM12920]MBE2996006.1 aspartate-semialdehyde dehydrogenase [Campylobacter sp. RM6913]MBE3030269.1 aspartate-semialdehyde dehydrogenase [Campylobacter sp. RM9344]
MRKFNVAIVGATGAVGEELLNVLAEVDFPVANILPLASAKSAGSSVEFGGKEYKVVELTESVFEEHEVDIAFFSAGGSVSAKFAPLAAASGAVVIDNTSHFRMDADVPLVVPECNPQDIALWKTRGIIANPNCSTIQMVQILKPLDDVYDIQRVDVSTYQAASGAGKEGMEELVLQMQKFFEFKLDECEPKVFAHRLAFNVIPHIDVFLDNDYTKEEMKMVNETQKILHKNMEVSATCVRVPVLRSHSEAITIHFAKDVDALHAKEILSKAPSLIVLDNPSKKEYPMPLHSTDTNDTYVGRIRVDNYRPNVLHLWCSADQIRVGAATNAVRIAQKWIELPENAL